MGQHLGRFLLAESHGLTMHCKAGGRNCDCVHACVCVCVLLFLASLSCSLNKEYYPEAHGLNTCPSFVDAVLRITYIDYLEGVP